MAATVDGLSLIAFARQLVAIATESNFLIARTTGWLVGTGISTASAN